MRQRPKISGQSGGGNLSLQRTGKRGKLSTPAYFFQDIFRLDIDRCRIRKVSTPVGAHSLSHGDSSSHRVPGQVCRVRTLIHLDCELLPILERAAET